MRSRNTARQYIIAASIVACAPAMAGLITFDEFAPDNGNGGIPANRYAYMGVTFNTTDDGSTWGGNSNGNPGNWGLEGTNGPIFSGYNGASYNAGISFASSVTGVSLDASRSNGSQQGDTYTLEGWLSGALVDSMSVIFGAINDWSTLSLAGTYDELRWSGAGPNFHPYGVDNIRWDNAVPEPGSLLLAALALGAMGAIGRRTRRS